MGREGEGEGGKEVEVAVDVDVDVGVKTIDASHLSVLRSRYLWSRHKEGSCHIELQGKEPFDQEGDQMQG